MLFIDSKINSIGSKVVIIAFLLSGSFHLINPGVFQALIPPILGMQNFWIIPGDPEIFKTSDGTYFMIYGGFEESLGGYLNLAKANSNVPMNSISSELQQPGQLGDMSNLPECKPGEPPTADGKPCRNAGK
jgi:hypothetical protein